MKTGMQKVHAAYDDQLGEMAALQWGGGGRGSDGCWGWQTVGCCLKQQLAWMSTGQQQQQQRQGDQMPQQPGCPSTSCQPIPHPHPSHNPPPHSDPHLTHPTALHNPPPPPHPPTQSPASAPTTPWRPLPWSPCTRSSWRPPTRMTRAQRGRPPGTTTTPSLSSTPARWGAGAGGRRVERGRGGVGQQLCGE